MARMIGAQVHFEVFVRRKPNAPWTLELATEDRARAVEAADEMLANGLAAVRVTKETLDPETREFRSVVVLSKGAVESTSRRKAQEEPDGPLCVTPQDLYSMHARERIGRLLDGWLRRKSVTAFELLHRPDLVEALEASGTDLQHAVQKIAVPEAQARGVSTHDMMRTFQKLVDRAIERVLKDGKAKSFPVLTQGKFADIATRLADIEAERAYLLGGAVAAYIAPARNWSEKIGMLLDLADEAPEAGRARGLALSILEQPLAEMAASRGALSDLLGADLDLGGSLGALTRLAAGEAIKRLAAYDPNLDKVLPPLTGQAARLAEWLQREAFETVRSSLAQRVLRELTGPRRLRPSDPDGEIAILRALAMALTAASGPLLPMEDVQNAFILRSKSLVAGDFVESYLQGRESALAEAEALVRLAENVAGSVNKRTAARWLSASISALRFEKEMRFGPDTPANKLAALAALQRGVLKAGLAEGDSAELLGKIGDVGLWIETDAKLVTLIARAEAPAPHRLMLLLRLACGEAGPRGPVADKAKAEALKLLRVPAARAELAAAPETLDRVKSLMSQAGIAA
jgi:hypothetical protein